MVRVLEPELVAIHLYGSAVDGGLKPHSDIDLLVTTRLPLTTVQRETLMQALLTMSAYPGTSVTQRALEVTVVVWFGLCRGDSCRKFLTTGRKCEVFC
jgi:streptomycin 3"-adenylyltransferase